MHRGAPHRMKIVLFSREVSIGRGIITTVVIQNKETVFLLRPMVIYPLAFHVWFRADFRIALFLWLIRDKFEINSSFEIPGISGPI
ncbi:hypothetical protein HKBW3S42_00516 [Candidatus Hakubella thermalkaliphila]|uniref:Uncharacterized protein n=1 Tax=Candidatus Hakubella thermalkaliphila TaxID=2754717 RepID=A0A6V8PMW2_9ACTN|nr:hypothetical protein HKBW3S42_00516 [Candidatus Hakubella thermalkaliphila]